MSKIKVMEVPLEQCRSLSLAFHGQRCHFNPLSHHRMWQRSFSQLNFTRICHTMPQQPQQFNAYLQKFINIICMIPCTTSLHALAHKKTDPFLFITVWLYGLSYSCHHPRPIDCLLCISDTIRAHMGEACGIIFRVSYRTVEIANLTKMP